MLVVARVAELGKQVKRDDTVLEIPWARSSWRNKANMMTMMMTMTMMMMMVMVMTTLVLKDGLSSQLTDYTHRSHIKCVMYTETRFE